MNILSLYDGMSCGMLAMIKAGIQVDNYYAYEIDKYAVKTSQHNFPQIKQCGDVFKADFSQYKGIDYLIGGSPCTYWSCAQSPDKRETTASGIGWELFSQYVRALKEAKPKFFIYENNKSMSKAIRESMTQTFGFEDICINSALLSAQNRQRLYWVGKRNADGTYSEVDVQQPEDRGILLRDVLDGADLTNCDKAYCLTSSYDGACAWNTIERHQRSMVAEPVGTTNNGKAYCLSAGYSNGSGEKIGNYAAHETMLHIHFEFDGDIPVKAISAADGKTYTVYEVKNGNITIKGKTYPIKLIDGYYIIRKLTVSECKRLQTVPEWYEFPVSDTQAYKMLGNGFTINVIAHLIEATIKNKEY